MNFISEIMAKGKQAHRKHQRSVSKEDAENREPIKMAKIMDPEIPVAQASDPHAADVQEDSRDEPVIQETLGAPEKIPSPELSSPAAGFVTPVSVKGSPRSALEYPDPEEPQFPITRDDESDHAEEWGTWKFVKMMAVPVIALTLGVSALIFIKSRTRR